MNNILTDTERYCRRRLDEAIDKCNMFTSYMTTLESIIEKKDLDPKAIAWAKKKKDTVLLLIELSKLEQNFWSQQFSANDKPLDKELDEKFLKTE